jgi:serine/threonine protein kinase
VSLERSKQVQTIFQRAMECPPDERNAFLSEYCGGDADLRMEVEQLFTQASAGGLFPGKPAGEGETLTLDYPHSLLGRRLGPYQIVARIGAGGMGEVYRAHDGKLGRDVAIKTLPAEFAHNHDRLIRFRREARMLASLNHPNIAAIYGLQDSDDVDCLVMELVEGESPKGPCSVTEALGTAAQIAHALSAAHEKGIVHRDLKPANIKVTQEGRVKVLDFGLAKALGPEQDADLQQLSQGGGDVTMVGNIIGTPAYMSPEQARGERVDQRADIWAFGCILFELLTGKRIFQRRTLRETLEAVLEREPEWHELPARTPAPVRSLLRHCLRKDPERRLSDIGGAIRVIEAVQRGEKPLCRCRGSRASHPGGGRREA